MIKNNEILVVEKFDDIPFAHCCSFGKYKSLSIAQYIIKRLNQINIKACIWKWNKNDPTPTKLFHIIIEEK